MSPLPGTTYLQLQKDGSVIILVHVMPNAARTQATGLHDGALRVRLNAPPVDGKANAALELWAAQTLQIPRSAVQVLRGQTARRKQLEVDARHAAKALWAALLPPQ